MHSDICTGEGRVQGMHVPENFGGPSIEIIDVKHRVCKKPLSKSLTVFLETLMDLWLTVKVEERLSKRLCVCPVNGIFSYYSENIAKNTMSNI